jgi:hypothetical protein
MLGALETQPAKAAAPITNISKIRQPFIFVVNNFCHLYELINQSLKAMA